MKYNIHDIAAATAAAAAADDDDVLAATLSCKTSIKNGNERNTTQQNKG